MRIGIFGGTFDPVHNAHIVVAQKFIEQFRLEKCIVHPANISPFKVDTKPKIENEHRLKLLELAFENMPEISIDQYELLKGGVSFTIEFVEHLNDLYPNAKFYLLIGTDQAVHFHLWKDYQRITEFVTVVFENRNQELSEEEIAELISQYPVTRKPERLNVPAIDISSSMIRDKFQNNESVVDFLPPKVLEYIKENKLYI